ncbi:helix-turn-helix transcriptional regulator [Empedobacter sp. 225-1]|uniref:helix-turn-helix domain-containing protein n=1 Tax=Empedobacter sp. 225-1 TaxID=2746725 RepID=UPI0025789A16|nr:helix-turn-helix transcriptional regulator [Empedobacter sp. 225-1]MDM1521722.1 helix-turn-helix transcriptional regulator [Empedobacter sp. 225-1]
MDILETIALNIKKLRKEKGISQETLALKANIDRTYINDVENAKRNISIKMLEKISVALEINIKQLL